MSTMAATKQGRRPRRQFDDDFRAQAIRLVLDEGKTAGAVYFWVSGDRGSLRGQQYDSEIGNPGLMVTSS